MASSVCAVEGTPERILRVPLSSESLGLVLQGPTEPQKKMKKLRKLSSFLLILFLSAVSILSYYEGRRSVAQGVATDMKKAASLDLDNVENVVDSVLDDSAAELSAKLVSAKLDDDSHLRGTLKKL